MLTIAIVFVIDRREREYAPPTPSSLELRTNLLGENVKLYVSIEIIIIKKRASVTVSVKKILNKQKY